MTADSSTTKSLIGGVKGGLGVHCGQEGRLVGSRGSRGNPTISKGGQSGLLGGPMGSTVTFYEFSDDF